MLIQKKQNRLIFLSVSTFYPHQTGGAQLSSLTLFKELKNRGWDILIVCQNKKDSTHEHGHYTSDSQFGFTCLRYNHNLSREELLDFLLNEIKTFKPTNVLGEFFSGNIEKCFYLLEKISLENIKTSFFIRIIEGIKEKRSEIKIHKNIKIISNSKFTSNEINKAFDVETEIVTPFIDFQKIKSKNKNTREYTTFINPVKEKGVEIAIEIAKKMPKIKFLFVLGGWEESNYMESNKYVKQIKEIPNITIENYQSDISNVYSKTKILLVPSLFEETFGRVIIEAQANNIPVIGSCRGNIPSTLGDGGFIVEDYKNPEKYIEKINLLMKNKNFVPTRISLENSRMKDSIHMPPFVKLKCFGFVIIYCLTKTEKLPLVTLYVPTVASVPN